MVSFVVGDLFAFLSEYLSYLAFFALIIICSLSRIKLSNKHIAMTGLLILLLLISFIHSASGFGSYANIINILLIMLIAGNTRLSEKTQKAVSVISLLSFFALFVQSFNVWQNYINGIETINPNIIAQFLTLYACIIYVAISKFIKNKVAKNIIQIFLLVTTLVGASMCNSRTSILVIILMILFLRVSVIKDIILRSYKAVSIMLVLAGSIIPFLYVNMYNEGTEVDLLFSTDKRFYSGREKIWKYSIEELDYYNGYLWGLGTHHETAIGEVSNFHNWYIGEIYYFGILVSIILFLFVTERLSTINSNEIKLLALSVFIFGFFETSLQWEFSQMVFLPLLLFDTDKTETQRHHKRRWLFFSKKDRKEEI